MKFNLTDDWLVRIDNRQYTLMHVRPAGPNPFAEEGEEVTAEGKTVATVVAYYPRMCDLLAGWADHRLRRGLMVEPDATLQRIAELLEGIRADIRFLAPLIPRTDVDPTPDITEAQLTAGQSTTAPAAPAAPAKPTTLKPKVPARPLIRTTGARR